ncbi:restriction endonuclease subunit S [Rhizobium leguminosarum bv. viciae]|uniref:restriction endonuclease subunit S n=1 Tax=Rhizobium leguminosarum TaxID=384 RepID=UPI00103F9341|nr:restriction endonuclease subunit S [Rhizobium leguminosarum]TBZ36437.1 restriction endonuclease subunit S [Rhizobium leguminosarum bv. viciae]
MMTLAAWPIYDSYKDSGVDWLCAIPSSWSSMRLQEVATCNDDTINDFDYRDREIKYVDISSVDARSNTYTFETQAFRNAPSRARRLARHGDIVFSTVRPYLKAVATVKNPDKYLVFSTGFAVVRPKSTADQGFVSYALRNEDFISEVTARSVGASYPAINASDLFKLKLPLPPLPEQRAIAAFLDEKCAKVDEAVRIKEEQITLLRERRQILIQQAVTRGLNPDAPLHDSGIDWIGKIPAHWEVRRSKYVFTQRKELARKNDIQLSATQSYGVIPQDKFEELVGRRVVKIQTNLEKRKHVEIDDFVISMRSFQGGLERAFATGCIRSSYVILQPLESLSADFFGYLFKSPRYIKALQATGSFIRDGQDLNFDNFSKVDLFLPPMDEQVAIAAHIKVGCEKIDSGIAIKEQQIVALRDYRTSLIDATVTGKIKVA